MVMAEKVNILLLGGCGFFGRHILHELIGCDYVESVTIVDKVPPQMAYLNKIHEDTFTNQKVIFKSANLINRVCCEAIFEESTYDWVINAASETKSGQEDAIYEEGIRKLSCNIIQIAASKNVKMFVEISSGKMKSSDKLPITEDTVCEPFSSAAKYKLEVEKELKNTPGLPWIILRPALAYGPGDKLGLTPRMLVAAVSSFKGFELKLLWDESLKVNTVHVEDVARAVVWLCRRGRTGEVYNLADDSGSTQGSLSEAIASIFDIDYSFCGNAVSKLAMVDDDSITQLANEKYLEPWLRMCLAEDITYTPLSPYVDSEAIQGKHLNLDGSKIIGEGFKLKWPKLLPEKLKEVLDEYISMKLLPKSIYKKE